MKNVLHDTPYLENRELREDVDAEPLITARNFNLGYDLTVKAIKIGKLANKNDIILFVVYFVLIAFAIFLSVYFVF